MKQSHLVLGLALFVCAAGFALFQNFKTNRVGQVQAGAEVAMPANAGFQGQAAPAQQPPADDNRMVYVGIDDLKLGKIVFAKKDLPEILAGLNLISNRFDPSKPKPAVSKNTPPDNYNCADGDPQCIRCDLVNSLGRCVHSN